MHGSIDWLLGFDKRPRRTLARSPRAVPCESALPWAVVMISQTAVADDCGRASACAKAVDANTNRGVGISITAKTPNACGWCGVDRQEHELLPAAPPALGFARNRPEAYRP